MGTSDPVGYALAIDALSHPGTAKASRISRAVCSQAFFPGIDPATYATNLARVLRTAGQQLLLHRHVSQEPPLAPYAR